jgi:hypothetical protein
LTPLTHRGSHTKSIALKIVGSPLCLQSLLVFVKELIYFSFQVQYWFHARKINFFFEVLDELRLFIEAHELGSKFCSSIKFFLRSYFRRRSGWELIETKFFTRYATLIEYLPIKIRTWKKTLASRKLTISENNLKIMNIMVFNLGSSIMYNKNKY